MAAVEDETKAEEVKAGELLFCGTTAWDAMGRRRTSPEENLVSPTRLRPLMGIDIRFVASGCGKRISVISSELLCFVYFLEQCAFIFNIFA